MLSLRASNEGLPRPRVARAQEHDRRPRFFESFLLPECFFQQRLYLAFGCHRIKDVGTVVKLSVVRKKVGHSEFQRCLRNVPTAIRLHGSYGWFCAEKRWAR